MNYCLLSYSDSESSGTDSEDAELSDSSPGSDTLSTPHIYEPSGTYSDSSFEHSISNDSKTGIQICHGKLKRDQPTCCNR